VLVECVKFAYANYLTTIYVDGINNCIFVTSQTSASCSSQYQVAGKSLRVRFKSDS